MSKTEIIPVIHMTSQQQVLTNVETCVQCGIRKVFLINHAVDISDMMNCAYMVKRMYSDLWVGVNPLGMDAQDALNSPSSVDGLWCDERIVPINNRVRAFKGLVFGGVAFKYQPQPADLKEACEEAKIATDVATTSGSGTGKPATVAKIKAMREYLGTHPLAIASGISAENINDYSGLADYLLVATSITDQNEMIVKEKLSELLSKIQSQ